MLLLVQNNEFLNHYEIKHALNKMLWHKGWTFSGNNIGNILFLRLQYYDSFHMWILVGKFSVCQWLNSAFSNIQQNGKLNLEPYYCAKL